MGVKESRVRLVLGKPPGVSLTIPMAMRALFRAPRAVEASLLCLLAGSAAASEPSTADGAPPVPGLQLSSPGSSPAEYRIGPADTLSVTVRNHPDLSEISPVRPDGYISLPLLEDVRAAGSTPMQLAAELEDRLREFIVEPEVMVEVLAAVGGSREVRVIGEASAPRPLPFTAGMSVLDVLTEIGGLTPYADGNATVLVRGIGPSSDRIPLRLDDLLESGDASADLAVQPGDVIVIPRGFFAGEWRTAAAVSLTQTFTDNVNLDPDGQRDPALITALTPSIELAGTGGRIRGALSASVSGEYQTLSHSGPSALVNVLGSSTAELVRDRVFVDALGSISQQPLNADAATSATESNDTNLTTVQAYSLSPYWLTQVDGVADIEARYIFGATLAGNKGGESSRQNSARDSESLSDSVTNGAVISLRSPEDIVPRVQAQQSTYGLRTTRFGASDVTAVGTALTPSYALAPGLALLATAGYDVLDAGEDDLRGPNAAAGFRYRPSPAFSLNATGGWRLEHPQADVVARYEVGPQTTLGVTYNDSVGVGQTNLLQNLNSLGYDPVAGRFINQQTSLAFSSALSGVDISDQLTRIQQGRLTIEHQRDTDDFMLGVYATRQRDVGGSKQSNSSGNDTSNDQDSWGLSGTWGRKLGLATGVSASVGFQYTDANDGVTDRTRGSDTVVTGTFRTVLAGVTLTHDFSDRLMGFVGYRFQRRFASESDNEFTENVVLLGVAQRF